MTAARITLASTAALAALFYSAAASATVATIALPDLVPSNGPPSTVVANVGQTYTGNGFVGMRVLGDFVHAFAIEHTQNYDTKDLIQADISAFSGATINSATLSFVFLDGSQSYDMTATGFAGTGSIGYQFTPPPATFSAVTGAVGPGANNFDVTEIVSNAAAANTAWLNLLLQGSGCCVLTFTQGSSVPGRTADAALVRLTVDYTAAAPIGGGVPEPSTWAMLLTGFGGLGGIMRTRRARAGAL